MIYSQTHFKDEETKTKTEYDIDPKVCASKSWSQNLNPETGLLTLPPCCLLSYQSPSLSHCASMSANNPSKQPLLALLQLTNDLFLLTKTS